MQTNKPYFNHFVRGNAKNRKTKLPSTLKSCYNYDGKGHLANKCFIFWKKVEDRFILVLSDNNPTGMKRGTNFKGSKQIWIPKRC